MKVDESRMFGGSTDTKKPKIGDWGFFGDINFDSVRESVLLNDRTNFGKLTGIDTDYDEYDDYYIFKCSNGSSYGIFYSVGQSDDKNVESLASRTQACIAQSKAFEESMDKLKETLENFISEKNLKGITWTREQGFKVVLKDLESIPITLPLSTIILYIKKGMTIDKHFIEQAFVYLCHGDFDKFCKGDL